MVKKISNIEKCIILFQSPVRPLNAKEKLIAPVEKYLLPPAQSVRKVQYTVKPL